MTFIHGFSLFALNIHHAMTYLCPEWTHLLLTDHLLDYRVGYWVLSETVDVWEKSCTDSAPCVPAKPEHLLPGQIKCGAIVRGGSPGCCLRIPANTVPPKGVCPRLTLLWVKVKQRACVVVRAAIKQKTKPFLNLSSATNEEETVSMCALPRKKKALLLLWSPATWVIPYVALARSSSLMISIW